MSSPMQKLKLIPWLPLLQIGLLTSFWNGVLDWALWGATQVPVLLNALVILVSPPLDVIVPLAILIGFGAIAVYFLEVIFPKLTITLGVLWGLVACVTLLQLARTWIPLPRLWMSGEYDILLGTLVGIFWKSRRYWR